MDVSVLKLEAYSFSGSSFYLTNLGIADCSVNISSEFAAHFVETCLRGYPVRIWIFKWKLLQMNRLILSSSKITREFSKRE